MAGFSTPNYGSPVRNLAGFTAPNYGTRPGAPGGFGGLKGKADALGNLPYDQIFDLARQQAVSDFGANSRRYELSADLASGGDPYLRAYGSLGGRFQAGEDLAKALNDARLRTAQAAQSFRENVYLARLQAQAQRDAANASKPSALDYVAQLAGTFAPLAFSRSSGGSTAAPARATSAYSVPITNPARDPYNPYELMT